MSVSIPALADGLLCSRRQSDIFHLSHSYIDFHLLSKGISPPYERKFLAQHFVRVLAYNVCEMYEMQQEEREHCDDDITFRDSI